MVIDIIAGARPNFIKVAPIINAIKASTSGLSFRLIHTGQHYDPALSGSIFNQLNLPSPNINLNVGSGSQAQQTSKIMIGYEKFIEDAGYPALTLVVGDVNSTLACTLVAKKANLKVAHVEAGIRSGDLSMPEEINRLATDALADYFFTTTELADNNLINAGISPDRIFRVGNVMIDTLLANQPNLIEPACYQQFALSAGKFYLCTLHRPSNVDHDLTLQKLLATINSGSAYPVILPVHPRIKHKLEGFPTYDNIHFIDPLSYLEFVYLIKNSRAVITDSGGIQEETTVLGVPCLTLRNNTERPETINVGTNQLVGTNLDNIRIALGKVNQGAWKSGQIPELWDGKSSDRIVKHLARLLNS